MPHLFSAINSNRQSGKITSGTQIVGSTKGIGSTSRMVSHCKSNSENPSNCINAVLNISSSIKEDEIKPSEIIHDLFNKDSFSKCFNFHGDGLPCNPNIFGPVLPQRAPEKYINGLNRAADRWGKFLKIGADARYHSINNISGFNGIELVLFNIHKDLPLTENWIARCGQVTLNKTGIVVGFMLFINFRLAEDYSNDQLAEILTHELGHALGISNEKFKCYDPYPEEIQPLEYRDNAINTDPFVLGLDKRIGITQAVTFPTLIDEYYKYGGIKRKGESDKKIESENIKLALFTTNVIPTYSDDNDPSYINPEGKPTILAHWRTDTLYTKNWDSDQPDESKKRYSGLYNEVMTTPFSIHKNYYISRVSLGRLIDLYNSIDGYPFFNYTEINPGASEVASHRYRSDKSIEFSGSKSFDNSLQNTEKNIQDDSGVFCKLCDPIFIEKADIKKYFPHHNLN